MTASKVEALYRKPRTTVTADGGGLYFRKRTNSASWVIRRARNKVASYTTIGRYPEMSLAEARKFLDRFGTDSIDNKTVADLLQDWFDKHRASWRRPEQMAGYIRRLTEDDPRLANMNIHVVDLLTVRRSLKSYAKRHGSVAANRLMEILKQVFKHAVQIGYLQCSPIVDLTRKVVGGIETPRQRVLTDNEIQLLWHADRHTELFRFLLLTGQRIRETQIARWSDIDGNRWFIPAANNKSARDHWVLLAHQSLALLQSQRPKRGRIFNTASPTAVQAYLHRWCERQSVGQDNQEQFHKGYFTPHDLRRTFATRLNELKVGPHIVEKILNHRLSGVMAVYNQTDYFEERAIAMQLWADRLDRIVQT
ncbi:MAG: tyrosine-type recombinase/integrase [Gammaproteobacteria bacterium]|nr:tyrosine-type recombinase/integrase [Gammaproteobacteria bacterium]